MSKKKGSQEPGSPENREKKRQERKNQARGKRRKKIILSLAVVGLVVVAAGAAVTIYEQRAEAVRDLTGVGAGVPAVVQVHDNTCPICTELRANVERIEGDFSDDALLIRVADVHTEEGLQFASRYTDARRATLLFIDGEGNLVNEVGGAQGVAALRRLFEDHADGEL